MVLCRAVLGLCCTENCFAGRIGILVRSIVLCSAEQYFVVLGTTLLSE